VLSAVEKIRTPIDPREALALLTAFAEGKGIQDVVGGVAGIIENGVVTDSPNLRPWEGFSLEEELGEALGVPVRVYNDAALSALGEARAGAGEGYGRVAYLAIGTGVGGALVVNGDSGPRIEASEPGRIILDSRDARSLESLVGGASLASEFGAPAEELAVSVYDERIPALAEGVRALINLWTPDIFVLNGPLIYGTPAFRIEALDAELSRMSEGHLPPLVPARFKDESGLWGGVLA